MHGLRTSSVLILDDKDEEALEIQKALALKGIGAVLVPGGIDAPRPDTPLAGIRVAVLDIDLGFGTDSLGRVRYTAGVVRSLIDRENGPYVAVVWTQNPGDFELFTEELQRIDCPPAFTVPLEKDPVLKLDVLKRAERILEEVEVAIAGTPPIEFANLWEQVIRDAANATVTALAPQKPGGLGGTRAMDSLVALLDSEADTHALNANGDSMRALLAGLNPVHFDKVEERSARMTDDELAVVQPIREKAASIREKAASTGNGLSKAERAELNAALLLDSRADGFSPGSLYSLHDLVKLEMGPALPEADEVRFSTVNEGHHENARDVPVVFVEVSAACDHQQGKIGTARLIAGVAFVASTLERSADKGVKVSLRKGDYLRKIKPLWMAASEPLPSGEVVLVWNARYPVSVSRTALAGVSPIARLREPLLADLRAWLGYQAGRPGYASV